MTYNEAKDHCENMNGTLIKEQRIEDVYNVVIFLLFTFIKHNIFGSDRSPRRGNVCVCVVCVSV